MIIDELITLLKFDTSGMMKAEAFQKKLLEVKKISAEIVKNLTNVAKSVGEYADGIAKSIASNYEWAKSVGVAVDSYQRFEHVAGVVGGSLNDIKGDLEGWVRSAKASGQTLEDVFLREAASVKGMSAEQSHAMLKARGYSETSIKMIQQGEGALKKYLEQAQVIPEENLAAAQDYAKTWREVSSQISQLMNFAVASALPELKKIILAIKEFVARNREMIRNTVVSFFKAFANVLKIAYVALTPVIKAVEGLIKFLDLLTDGGGSTIVMTTALTTVFSALAIAIVTKAVAACIAFGTALAAVVVPSIIAAAVATWTWTAALLANPITWIVLAVVAGIAAIAAGIYLCIKYWDKIVAGFKAAFNWVKNLFSPIKENESLLTKLFKWIVNPLNALSFWWNLLKKIVKTVLDWFDKLMPAVDEGESRIAKIFKWLTMFAMPLSAIYFFWDKIKGAASKAWSGIGQFFGNLWDSAKNFVKKALESDKKFFAEIWKNVKELAGKVWPWLKKFFTLPLDFVKKLGSGIWDSIKGFFVKVWEVLVNSVTNFGLKIWEKITSIFAKTKSGVKSLFSTLGKIFVSPINEVWKKTSDLLRNVITQAKDTIKKIKQAIIDVAKATTDYILRVIGKIVNKVIDGVNRVIDGLNSLPGVNIEKKEHVSWGLTPENTVPTSLSNTALASPEQMVSNNQQSNSYVDQRNITINTNASSGPGIASYLKYGPSLVTVGLGMAGAF